ncbi:MAG: DUF503 domain-containing protein [Candidatus Auribacterota bacterium]
MVITLMQVQLSIPASHSLKEKRMVVKSVKDRIRHRFNVSISEIGDHEQWNSSVLGIACIGTDSKYVDTVLNDVIRLIDQAPGAHIIDYYQERL